MKQYSLEEIKAIYHKDLLELVFEAATVHRQHQDPQKIQICTLKSIKTGNCPEDCGYCSQSAHNDAQVESHKLVAVEEVIKEAKEAKEAGSSRFCMGAAWRGVRDNKDFENVLKMVEAVSNLGLEVCCTLGSLDEESASRLKKAGLHAYNHNLDTGPDYYNKVVTTRTYEDRLRTLKIVQDAGICLCSGGILGMGESEDDRIAMLYDFHRLATPPESIPINALIPVEGTKMENLEALPTDQLVRMTATTRIVIPTTRVRLSAGRSRLSYLEQGLCFLAGANSIFSGNRLLTTPNQSLTQDEEMMQVLGLIAEKVEK